MRNRGYDDGWDYFDSFIKDAFGFANDLWGAAWESPINVKNMKKFPSALVQGNFLPSNIYIDTTDKSYVVEVACAGIPKDKISIEFKDDYVNVRFNEEVIKDTGKGDAESVEAAVSSMETLQSTMVNGKRYIQRNIKEPKGQTLSFFIDTNYYDTTDPKASINDGLLKIAFKPLEKPEIETSKKILIE
jgi:HSP20 family molecular chaperone IbpA